MTKRTVSKTVQVCRQATKYKDIEVQVNIPEDASVEEENMLLEEAALEKSHNENFNDGSYYDEPTYFIG